MVNHADNNDVQEKASGAILNVVFNNPVHIAMAEEAGVVPLLQHAAAMGIENATKQLTRMGVGNWMDFTEGQLIDAKDDQGRWCEAEVTAVDEGRIHIHYLFWEQKHDEWVGAAQYPTRLAPASTAFYAKPKASRVDPEYFAAPKAKQWIDCFDIDPLTRYVEEKRSEEYAVCDV